MGPTSGGKRNDSGDGEDSDGQGADNHGDHGRATEMGEPAFEAGLYAAGVTFEETDAELLWAIDREGSLNAARDHLDRSLPWVISRVETLESGFGDLVMSERGGEGGGGSTLTDRARELLARFERIQAEFSGVVAAEETVYPGSVEQRDGEIATVRIEAGRVRALTPPEATHVQVTVRADSVTLHDPETAPEATETSARNRFEGVVETVEMRDAVATAFVDIGAGEPLRALVTRESVDQLNLEPGTPVVATFKTAATRATPRRM